MRRFLSSLVALLALCAAAQAAPPVAGRDYQVLQPPRPSARGHIEVIEFFYYGCAVCYEAQPQLTRWKQEVGPDVQYRRVPAVANESWEPLARAYFAFETLGALDRLHGPLFDSQHIDDRRLDQEANLLAWVAANGLDSIRFKAALTSIETRQKIEYARHLGRMHGVRALPTLAVGGRYLTSARMAGGIKEMTAVLEYLVERVRQERAAK